MTGNNGHAPKSFAETRSRANEVPRKTVAFWERTSDGVDEPCRLRLGEGYEVREDAARSRGLRGVAPDKQRGVFAAAEIARKAKWVPLCPACHVFSRPSQRCFLCFPA